MISCQVENWASKMLSIIIIIVHVMLFQTLSDFDFAKTFQNLKVSSPAPVTIV